MVEISVHGAPSEYLLKEGILQELEGKLLERNAGNVLVVHGIKSWEAVQPYWPVFQQITAVEYTYHGECSFTEIDAIQGIVAKEGFDAIIGVGGGKVLDLVKAVSHVTGKQAILIPTLASNCSPWTPLSVLYDDEGIFIRYDVYPVSASLVLVEPNILLAGPIELFIAGIGDTLAKWYEADVQIAGIKNKSVPLQIACYAARQCKDVLLSHSAGAITAVKAGQLNDEFIKVAETIIVFAGMVGGFGDQYGRIAAAHSIHNGLTVLEETHQALHGAKVAYGILVQLALEEKWEEIDSLLPFYRTIGLPLHLADLGVKTLGKENIAAVAEKAVVPQESIHVMPFTVTAEAVEDAISKLEAYVVVR
ncbi:iron-containing alcohol dehydrogenase family protein [Bacillaceae bacterium Marseille-Q3522]|nr:iron-containing alcohol dehydrogenase family protein [Bacillaceae bacterium Marseille-Q3522]